MNRFFLAAACTAALMTTGCYTPQESRPLAAAEWQAGIRLVQPSAAEKLPDGAVVLEGREWVWLPSVSSAQAAVNMLIPVPFVVDGVMGQVHQGQTGQFGSALGGLSPQAAMQRQLQQRNMLAMPGQGLAIGVFCFVQEGADDRYRMAFVAEVKDGEQSGRYMVHLPLALTLAELQRAHRNGELQQALDAAAEQMANLFDKAARGNLGSSVGRVNVGSLNLVSSKSSGMLSPNLVVAKNAQLVEEGANHVIVRMSGDASMPEGSGGLFYGVHYLLKSQLHTFEKRPG